MHKPITVLTATAVTSAALLALAAPADARGGHGGGRDVVHHGSCSGATDWKLKVGKDDGRLEVEAEVDGRAGRRWSWTLRHDGSVAASGTRTTSRPSGSFEVHRRLVDRAGHDTVSLRARSLRTGEICRGSIRL